jgi:tRNA(Arg) A34 adenosine deaminase TadA
MFPSVYGIINTMNPHEPFIRQCYDLAIAAGEAGNHTFGALLVHQGQVILTAENTVNTAADQTRHAELNLVARAQQQFPAEVLRECTLYTSTAPCLMCTGAIWWAGIPRVVYGVSYERFGTLIPGGYRFLHIGEVFRQLGTPMEAIGPVLEDEGMKVYKYWRER